jgi:hypothetical protein
MGNSNMSKRQEAMKLLSAKEMIDPVNFIIGDFTANTGLSPEQYYSIRYELAKANKNIKMSEEAWDCYLLFKKNVN